MALLRTVMTAGAVTALTVGSTVGLATAAPLERARFHESFSDVIEDFCGEITARIDVEADVALLFNVHGPDGLGYGLAAVHRTLSFTNLANDKTWTLVSNGLSKDLKVTDNGDGTLTLLVMDAGGGRTYGPDGEFLGAGGETTWYEILIDHGGTPTDPTDDVELDFRVVKGELTDGCPGILEVIG